MRYVDPERVQSVLPTQWFTDARDVKAALDAAPDAAARKKLIDDNSKLWRDAGRRLVPLMGGKCWYCEAHEERSDRPVDHFRPKGRVAGEVHGGYWWLAFEPANFRISCTFCNSKRRDVEGESAGGKADEFPLEPGGVRALEPGDDLGAEKPLLLDPTDPRDVCLLLFDETGLPSLNAAESRSEHDALRIKRSIKLYHWHHRPVASGRRVAFARVAILCKDGDRLLREFQETGDQRADAERQRILRALNKMVDRETEHSAAALCALRGLRTASETALDALTVP